MNKLFNINMTWAKTIVFALVCGVATGIIMQVPALENTSIRNMGVTMEFWIFAGMIVALNCKKWWEAGLKTFVFFLISQPLVYLVMWPVYQCFPLNYYMYWFYWTLASFACGCAAWYIKKGNVISVIILLAVCGLLCFHGADFLYKTLVNGQHQLLAALFCFAQVVLYLVALLPTTAKKLICGVVCAAATGAFLVLVFMSGPASSAAMPLEGANTCTAFVENENIVEVETTSDSSVTFKAKGYGTTTVTFTFPAGSTQRYEVTVERSTNSIQIDPLNTVDNA